MTRLSRADASSAGALGAIIGVGALLTAGVLAWRRSRAGEATLDERTRARLRPRHMEPGASATRNEPAR